MAAIGFGTTESWLCRGDRAWLPATDSCEKKDHNMVDYIMRECFCGFCWLRIKSKDKLPVL